MMPLVSIVMLSFNRKDDVYESLLNINKISYTNFEIIVVDNASTDGTVDMLNEFPNVKLLVMDNNIGIEAYNYGFEAAKGKYIVIIDDDSFPAPDAIGKMVDKFEENASLGVVAFDVRNFYHYDEVALTIQEVQNAEASSQQYLLGFNGAGVGVRTELFKKIGYYPAEFFLYNNELDTAFRVLNEGYEIKFYNDIVAYHKYSPINRASWRAPFYYTRNGFWLVWKHYNLLKSIKVTTYLMYLCVSNSIEQKTTVYLKAMLSAFKDINRLKGKRKPVDDKIADRLRIPFETFFTFYR